jgi:hypothetical protein
MRDVKSFVSMNVSTLESLRHRRRYVKAVWRNRTYGQMHRMS